MTEAACSALSLASGEPLAGTATQAARWLVVEWNGRWGHDAIAESGLPDRVSAALQAFDGRVLLVRRPDRTGAVTVFEAHTTEEGGTSWRYDLASLDELDLRDRASARPLDRPLYLVCAHGRRDPCCARLGRPLYDALAEHVPADLLWQSSHQGGHRFAANLLVLPSAVQLGRVSPDDAAHVSAALADGRIPLAHFRGRALFAPHVQTAEAALRSEAGLDRIGDVRVIADETVRVRFATPAGTAVVRVRRTEGTPQPPSCGAAPEAGPRYVAALESLA